MKKERRRSSPKMRKEKRETQPPRLHSDLLPFMGIMGKNNLNTGVTIGLN